MHKTPVTSLIGKLSFAGKVLPTGRIFIRRLVDLATTARTLSHRVNLSQDTRADIEWWQHVLPLWPGKSYFLTTLWQLSPEIQLFTDAAGSHGFGACWNGQLLCGHWLERHQQKSFSIVWKELYAIVIAAAIWGSKWTEKRLLFHCDNHVVLDIWRQKTTKDKHIMQLVRSLYFIAARGNFTVSVSHIHGVNNTLADALSHEQVEKFKALAQLADPEPTPLPPNWESLWTTTFGSFNVQQ